MIKAYLLFIYIICCIYRYTSIEINPDLKNIFKFGYGLCYKYKGMLVHSFDRIYIATKFILPTIEDFKLSSLNFDNNCEYLREKDKEQTEEGKQHVSDLVTYCRKIGPHIYFYKQQIKSLNERAHQILKNKIDLILPQFSH